MGFLAGLALGLIVSLMMPHRVVVHNDSSLTCPEVKNDVKQASSIPEMLDRNNRLVDKLIECERELNYEKIKSNEHYCPQPYQE